MREETAIAEIAARQDGLVSTAQLLAAGLTYARIRRWVQAGRLHPHSRGVYAVGHTRLGPRGLVWGAVLATGGVASHQTAAWLHDLLPPPALPVHVTTTRGARDRRDVRVHRSPSLREVVLLDHLPATTVARTLEDLPPRLLANALRQAEYHRVLDIARIRSERVRRAANRLAEADPTLPKGELELLFLAICHDYDLPKPLVNAHILGRERDFAWPAQRLVVETDGRKAHATLSAMGRDRERDRELVLAGWRALRFLWGDVVWRREMVAHTLSGLFVA